MNLLHVFSHFLHAFTFRKFSKVFPCSKISLLSCYFFKFSASFFQNLAGFISGIKDIENKTPRKKFLVFAGKTRFHAYTDTYYLVISRRQNHLHAPVSREIRQFYEIQCFFKKKGRSKTMATYMLKLSFHKTSKLFQVYILEPICWFCETITSTFNCFSSNLFT